MANEIDYAKAEIAAWLDLGSQAAFAKVEVAAWIEPDQAAFSKAEIGAWLEASSAGSVRRRQAFVVN